MSELEKASEGFYCIDNDFLRKHGPKLKASGIAVYNALCMHANRQGRCHPSFETIAQLAGMSRVTAIRTLAQMEKDGFVTVERVIDKGDKSNFYQLNMFHQCDKSAVSKHEEETKAQYQNDTAVSGSTPEAQYQNVTPPQYQNVKSAVSKCDLNKITHEQELTTTQHALTHREDLVVCKRFGLNEKQTAFFVALQSVVNRKSRMTEEEWRHIADVAIEYSDRGFSSLQLPEFKTFALDVHFSKHLPWPKQVGEYFSAFLDHRESVAIDDTIGPDDPAWKMLADFGCGRHIKPDGGTDHLAMQKLVRLAQATMDERKWTAGKLLNQLRVWRQDQRDRNETPIMHPHPTYLVKAWPTFLQEWDDYEASQRKMWADQEATNAKNRAEAEKWSAILAAEEAERKRLGKLSWPEKTAIEEAAYADHTLWKRVRERRNKLLGVGYTEETMPDDLGTMSGERWAEIYKAAGRSYLLPIWLAEQAARDAAGGMQAGMGGAS